MSDFTIALGVAYVSYVLVELTKFVSGMMVERRKRRYSRAVTLTHQLIDGSGYGLKDEGTETKGKQCVPVPWLRERASELEAELKSLKIRVFALEIVPTKSHVVGYLFRLKELLEEGNLREARRFSTSFTDTLKKHPWDRDESYVPQDSASFTDSTAIRDVYKNESPIGI